MRQKNRDKWWTWRDWFKPKEVKQFKSLEEQRQLFKDTKRMRGKK